MISLDKCNGSCNVDNLFTKLYHLKETFNLNLNAKLFNMFLFMQKKDFR